MRVTGGIRTGRLIFDRVDQSQQPLSAGTGEDTHAVRALQSGQRSLLRTTSGARFCTLVHPRVNFPQVRREADPTFFIEDADLADARLGSQSRNDLVDLIAVVAHHAVAGTSFNGVADPI